MSPSRVRSLAAVLLAALLLASCGPAPASRAPATVETTASTGGGPAPTTESSPTPRPAALATATLRPTLPASSTPAPTSTSPAPTEPPLPSPSATPAPATAPSIGPDNAGQVALLARLGRGAVQDMAWLPGGQGILAAHYAGLSLYDAATLDERRFVPAYGWKAGLAASPDGRHAAFIAGGRIQVWDLAGGEMVTLAEPAGGIKKLAFGAGGATLAVLRSEQAGGQPRDSVDVLDLTGLMDGSGGQARLLYRLDGFATAVYSLAFSADGRVLATSRQTDWSAPDEPTLALWDAAGGQPLPVTGDWAGAPGGLQELTFSADGRFLAGASVSTLVAWEVAGGRLLASIENGAWVNTLAWSADGRLLAAGSPDGQVRVWDPATAQQRATLAVHPYGVLRLAFDPAGGDEVLLAAASARGGVQLWAAGTGERRATHPQVGHTAEVGALAYSPDGRLLATAGTDETIWLWDSASGEPLGMMDAAGMSTGQWCACFWSLAFSPDGQTLAVGSTDAVVRLWDVETRQLIEESEVPTDLVYSLAYSPDGRRLVAGDGDGHLWAWDAAAPLSAGPVLSLDNPPTTLNISFQPFQGEGEYVLATGSGFGAIRLWDLSTGSLVREMRADGNIVRAVYSPDGTILAAGSSGYEPNYEIRFWDPARGEVVRRLKGHDNDVTSLAFSPDGRVLASGDAEGLNRLWDVATGVLLQNLDQEWRVDALAFRPDGRRLVSAGSDGLIWIWGVPGE